MSLVNYIYDTGGNLQQVPGFATYSGYNALGQVGSVTYGNNINMTIWTGLHRRRARCTEQSHTIIIR